MARAGQILRNPVTGQDLVFRRTAAESFPALASRWGPVFPFKTGLEIGDYRDIARRLVWPAEHDGTRPGVMIETDPMLEKAIDSLPKAKALLDSAKKMIVQRLSK